MAAGTSVVSEELLLDADPTLHRVLPVNGFFLEELQERSPDQIEKIRQAIRRGQLEILVEGYSAPIYSLIPERDRRLQLQYAMNIVQEILGVLPAGVWFPGASFSSHFIPLLAELGVEYAVIDPVNKPKDAPRVGSPLDYYISEEEGVRFPLFFFDPSDKDVPMLETPYTHVQEHPAGGRVYVSVSPNARQTFLNNSRADFLHKKMLWVSNIVHAVAHPPVVGSVTEDRQRKITEARKALFMGQSAQAFHHPDVYFDPQYRALLRAEKIADDLKHPGASYLDISVTDFDFDGKDEIVVATPFLMLGISPGKGGQIYEYAHRPAATGIGKCLGDVILPASSARDHCMTHPAERIEDFRRTEYAYYIDRKSDETRITLDARGSVADIRKTIVLHPHSTQWECGISVTGKHDAAIPALFGTEWSFTDKKEIQTSDVSVSSVLREFNLIDVQEDFHLSFTFSSPARVWRISEENRFLFHWPISLSKGEIWEGACNARIT